MRPRDFTPRKFPSIRPEIQLFTPTERRNRWIRFLLCEVAALASLVFLVYLAVSRRIIDTTVTVLIYILIVAATAAVVTFAVTFFRDNPARWGRDH
ncbi:MAG: hypothetical protein QOI34_183 [Verrucomicrobiota bacterium]